MKLLWMLNAVALFGQPAKWPGVLEADVNAGAWEAAGRVGQAIVKEIDAGRMFSRFSDVPAEAKVRRLYAEALDHAGNPNGAREQRCLADPEPSCAAKAALEHDRRVANLRMDLLAIQVKEPAAPLPFAADGKVLVVVFWAAWCAPCIRELEILHTYRNLDAKVLPVDVDRLDAAAKTRFVLPESLEGPEIPQLYVFDPAGNIRFHLRGFEDDGWFPRKLDWMIEAALK